MVGLNQPDDAGVYQISADLALTQKMTGTWIEGSETMNWTAEHTPAT
jgi:hypothetical protein